MNYTHLDDVHKITNYNKIVVGQVKYRSRHRIYGCLDINCFYAQDEERDHHLEGVPLIVGGWKDMRNIAHGIVATSNYVARGFGIKTGMSALEATQLCPHVLMFQVDYEKYKAISNELKEILLRYSPEIEMYSLDEAFMDLTSEIRSTADAEEFVRKLKTEIWEKLELTVNIGISITKTYSKILADMNKPDGHMVAIDDSDIMKIIFPLTVDHMWGIGRRRKARLNVWGIQSIGQIAFSRKQLLQKIFGPIEGETFWLMARGEEETVIITEAKDDIDSISHMHTFPTGTLDADEIWGEVIRGVERVAYRLRGYGKLAREFNLYFRPQNLHGFGETFRIPATNYDLDIINAYKERYDRWIVRILRNQILMRGIGLFANLLKDESALQYSLFDDTVEKKHQLYQALDKIKNKNDFALIRAADSMVFVKGRTHFVDRSTY